MSVDWNDISTSYAAHTAEALTPEQIDSLPEPMNHMVWATILDVRQQAYEMGHVDGYHDCQDDYDPEGALE